MLRPRSKSRPCPACAAWRDRARGALVLTLIAIFTAALTFSPLDYRYSENSDNVFFLSLVVQQREAFADSIDEYNSFLDEMANQAGMETADYIATVTGVSNIATGYNFVKNGGLVGFAQRSGVTTAENLDSLIDAANYPSWDSLSDTDQQYYVNKEAYDAAKFNSLMDAFGLGQARERFYSSGGGNFEWYDDELEKLQQIGAVGNNWLNNLGNTFADVTGLVTDSEFFSTWPSSAVVDIDGSNELNWPSAMPTDIQLVSTSMAALKNTNRPDDYYYYLSNPIVYFGYFTYSDGYYAIWRINKTSFKTTASYNQEAVPNVFANSNTSVANEPVYYNFGANNTLSTLLSVNLPENVVNGNTGVMDNNAKIAFTRIMLYGNKKLAPSIADYPETTPNNNLNVYFPSGGVTTNNTWNNYTTQPSPEPETRPENPYNPDNQTGGEQWKDDTESNVLPLLDIKFDQLFPFSMLYDIPKLFEKVQATAPNYGEYNEITIPVDLPGESMDTNIVLDLDDLANLGAMIRPFLQILLAAGLLFVTIKFWQGVLTG